MGVHALSAAGRAAVRTALADEIERLIAILDALDGDAEAEADADGEPSLAGFQWGPGDDRELDPADLEPSLGWLGRMHQYGNFCADGVFIDAEASGELAGGSRLEAGPGEDYSGLADAA